MRQERSTWRAVAQVVAAVLAFATAAMIPGVRAFGAGSPGGDHAAAWPAQWSTYRYADGAAILDVNGDESPVDTDLASGACTGTRCTGTLPSVLWASDGANVFFRIRLAADPWDAAKGGLRSSAYLVQLAVNGSVAAVVGVDGKSSSSDYVYVTDSVGGVVQSIYTWPFDTSGGADSAALRTVPAPDGQYFLDFQVPLARITALNPAVTAATPLQLYYGSSAAANLATINKDFMRGNVSAVDFTGLSTVTLAPSSVALTRTSAFVSGANPPTTGAASTYDVPVTITNTGGADLDGATFTATLPAGVTVVSAGAASVSGSTITWAAGNLYAGGAATTTLRVTTTPADGTAGSSTTLLSALAVAGTDHTTGAARSATAADVTVGPVVQGNRPPATDGDTLVMAEDGTGTLPVLANDSDPDGDALSVSIVTAPQHGQVVVDADGTVTYTPAADFNGADAFTYRACDPSGACADAEATVTVTAVNDPPVAQAGTLTTTQNHAVASSVGATDVDGDALTYAVTSGPSHGTLALLPDGTFTYDPDPGYTGADSFTFEACDAAPACSPATIAIDVATADLPVANDDAVGTVEDVAATFDVQANDVDPDGLGLTTRIVTAPTKGTATVQSDGRITYVPDADANGGDAFTYRVCDTHALCSAAATVSVTVTPTNDAPTAGDDTATAAEDGSVVVAVLANDDDVDGDALVATITTAPAHGTATVGLDGRITYTPAPDFHGTDSLTYEVCDADDACATAEVGVTVSSVNDAPATIPSSFTTSEDTPAARSVTAADVDGDTLTYGVVAGPAHGTLVLGADGTFTYTPALDFHGADAFTYEACDPSDLCTPATVSITVTAVNDAPVAGDDATSVAEDGTVVIDVLTNDTDVDGDLLAVGTATVSRPAHGAAVDNGDGTITYTPDADFAGPDTFSYEACDPSGSCSTATVSVTVQAVDDAPVAAGLVVSTPEDTALAGQAVAADVEGDDVTYDLVTAPAHGTLALAPDGSFTYTPDPDFAGPDAFVFRACDPSRACTSATVAITVTAVNDRPVAADDSLTTPADTSVAGTIIATDADGDALAWSMASPPQHGTVTADGGTPDRYRYSPDAGWSGVDRFTVDVCDPAGACSPAVVTVTVTPVSEVTADGQVAPEPAPEVVTAADPPAVVTPAVTPAVAPAPAPAVTVEAEAEAAAPAPEAAATALSNGGLLPRTGAGLAGEVALALGVIGAGVLLVLAAGRRRRTS